jgi:type II secretory pathway pseudopilin PulG
VLGLISALTLPAVFNAINERKKMAIFKETFNALQNAASQEASNGETLQSTIEFVQKNMNVKECGTTIPISGATTSIELYACILQNGAYLYHLNGTAALGESIMLDWNGNDAPNIRGQDRLYFYLSWSNLPTTTWYGETILLLTGENELKPAGLLPSATDRTFYGTIYQ